MFWIKVILTIIVPIIILLLMNIILRRIHFFIKLLYLSVRYKNIKVINKKLMWLLGINMNKHADLYVIAGDRLYIIKICGIYNKRTIITIENNLEWRLAKYSLMAARGSIPPFQKMQSIKFDLSEENQRIERAICSFPEIQETSTVLLFSPVPMDVQVKSEGERLSLLNGGKAFENEIYTCKNFLNAIKKYAKASTQYNDYKTVINEIQTSMKKSASRN